MNRQIILASRPAGMPTTDNFKLSEIPVPVPAEGEVLLKSLFISVDPYMRGRMSDAESYIPPFVLSEPVNGAVVARVTESRHPDFAVGDAVLGHLRWQEFQTAPAAHLTRLNQNQVPLSYYLGTLGMTGLTAYFGLLEIGKPVAGETVVVTAAAGAVGSIACQIAKLKGCRVVAITGSDEKVNYLKNTLKVDEVINYHSAENLQAAVANACQQGVDVYFDNVGGEIADAVFANINKNARIILCGQISVINRNEMPAGPRWQPLLVKKSALMQGFIVTNYSHRFGEGVQQLAQWLGEGKLVSGETVVKGFEKLPETFISLFKGENTGKLLVDVSS